MTEVYATARQMLADLKAKTISARELLALHVRRNAQVHDRINAVVARDLDRAQAAAMSIDDARARGAELGALAGLPMTVKDGFDVAGLPATSGNPAFAGRPPGCQDADVAAAARKAGAVIWGKTNVPFMLSDFQTYNAIYGTTNNPYDLTRTPGGSSGGAAAALAAGVTPLEIGSDIGGSLRHPANYCGVCSLKPTWGALSGRGHIPPAPGSYYEADLGVMGPMARNIGDLRLLWNVLHGGGAAAQSAGGARIAVWAEEDGWPLASEVREGVDRAAAGLARAGMQVTKARPDIDSAQLMNFYRVILMAIVGSDLPEAFIRGLEANRDADRALVLAGGAGSAEASTRLGMVAAYRDVAWAHARQQACKDRLAAFFADYDAILMPISIVPPFAHNQEAGFADRVLRADNRDIAYPEMLDWIAPATALHMPAVAVPAGRTAGGLPVGVQLVGPWGKEDRLLDLAAALEQETGGFSPPPL
ncbi:MAG TPA: amidase family protein [Rhizomicrobium sp.]|nr:amidase family protein [Rhizomicrobium sp.]